MSHCRQSRLTDCGVSDRLCTGVQIVGELGIKGLSLAKFGPDLPPVNMFLRNGFRQIRLCRVVENKCRMQDSFHLQVMSESDES